jgi:hypothetical protein
MSGSGYRPLTDVWDLRSENEALQAALATDTMILARSKVPFYGSYPAGFLGRARAFLCRENEMLLHVCGGMVKRYPFAGLGPRDRTVDLDAKCEPDFLMDVRELGVETGDKVPEGILSGDPISPPSIRTITKVCGPPPENQLWPAALIDRPYTLEDAQKYLDGQGPAVLPDINDLLKRTLSLVVPGGRVGVLDYIWPQPPKKGVRCVAAISVLVGFNNRVRLYSVYEREMVPWRKLTGARGKVEMSEDEKDEAEMEDALARARAAAVRDGEPGIMQTPAHADMRPLTEAEAQAAYDAAPAMPLSPERINEIVEYATGSKPDPRSLDELLAANEQGETLTGEAASRVRAAMDRAMGQPHHGHDEEKERIAKLLNVPVEQVHRLSVPPPPADGKHTFEKRDDDLASCSVCKGGEGSLPTECPGIAMTEDQQSRIYGGTLDYVRGAWVMGKRALAAVLRPGVSLETRPHPANASRPASAAEEV